MLQAAATGIFTVRIISVMDDVGGDYSIVATKDITTVPDLKGKTIAFGIGTNFEYFLDLVLAKYWDDSGRREGSERRCSGREFSFHVRR